MAQELHCCDWLALKRYSVPELDHNSKRSFDCNENGNTLRGSLLLRRSRYN